MNRDTITIYRKEIKMSWFFRVALVSSLSFAAVGASAQCYGGDTSYTCYDQGSGNSYIVNRFGDTTFMQGSNARTGSNWSQTTIDQGYSSHSFGNAADGSSWNYTQPKSNAGSGLGSLGVGVGGRRCTTAFCY